MAGLLDIGNLGGLLGNVGAGAQNFLQSDSPASAIGNLLTGITTGQRTDPIGFGQQMQQQAFQALVANGVEPRRALLALQSPDMLKAVIADLNPQQQPLHNVPGGQTVLQGAKPIFTAPQNMDIAPGNRLEQTNPILYGGGGGGIQGSPLAPPAGGAGPIPLPAPAVPAPMGGGSRTLVQGTSPQDLAAQ